MRVPRDLAASHRRLAMLRLVSGEADCGLNLCVLRAALCVMGHAVPRETLDADALWLEEQGLALLRRPQAGLTVITATRRGADVAAGIARHPGVARPAPEED